MRISDGSSDVCSSDLAGRRQRLWPQVLDPLDYERALKSAEPQPDIPLDRGRRGVDKNRIEPAATQQPAADDDAADDEREIVEHEPHRTALPARPYRHASDVIAAGVPSDSRPGCGIARVHAPLGIVRLAGQHRRLGARHDEIGDELVDAERLRIKDVVADKYGPPPTRRGA